MRDWLFGTRAKYALAANMLTIGLMIGWLIMATAEEFSRSKWFAFAALALSVTGATLAWRRLP
jgi:hypothetical protein